MIISTFFFLKGLLFLGFSMAMASLIEIDDSFDGIWVSMRAKSYFDIAVMLLTPLKIKVWFLLRDLKSKGFIRRSIFICTLVDIIVIVSNGSETKAFYFSRYGFIIILLSNCVETVLESIVTPLTLISRFSIVISTRSSPLCLCVEKATRNLWDIIISPCHWVLHPCVFLFLDTVALANRHHGTRGSYVIARERVRVHACPRNPPIKSHWLNNACSKAWTSIYILRSIVDSVTLLS